MVYRKEWWPAGIQFPTAVSRPPERLCSAGAPKVRPWCSLRSMDSRRPYMDWYRPVWGPRLSETRFDYLTRPIVGPLRTTGAPHLCETRLLFPVPSPRFLHRYQPRGLWMPRCFATRPRLISRSPFILSIDSKFYIRFLSNFSFSKFLIVIYSRISYFDISSIFRENSKKYKIKYIASSKLCTLILHQS